MSMLSEVVSMITQENDECVFMESIFLQRSQHTTHLGINERDRSSISLNQSFRSVERHVQLA